MQVRTVVMALHCGLTGIIAVPAAASPVENAKLVQQVKDPASGLEVRVYVGGSADVSIEVGDRTVQIQKQLVHGAAVTRLTTPTERLTLLMDRQHSVVEGTLGRVEARANLPGSSDALRRVLMRSTAVDRAIALLGRLDLGPRSPVGHTLLVTRAMLLAETGDATGTQELARWIVSVRQAMALTPVGFQTGPGDCWKEYSKEAIATYLDMEDCIKDLHWYDFGGEFVCGSIYDLRAIGAFSWYLKCVALKS